MKKIKNIKFGSYEAVKFIPHVEIVKAVRRKPKGIILTAERREYEGLIRRG